MLCDAVITRKKPGHGPIPKRLSPTVCLHCSAAVLEDSGINVLDQHHIMATESSGNGKYGLGPSPDLFLGRLAADPGPSWWDLSIHNVSFDLLKFLDSENMGIKPWSVARYPRRVELRVRIDGFVLSAMIEQGMSPRGKISLRSESDSKVSTIQIVSGGAWKAGLRERFLPPAPAPGPEKSSSLAIKKEKVSILEDKASFERVLSSIDPAKWYPASVSRERYVKPRSRWSVFSSRGDASELYDMVKDLAGSRSRYLYVCYLADQNIREIMSLRNYEHDLLSDYRLSVNLEEEMTQIITRSHRLLMFGYKVEQLRTEPDLYRQYLEVTEQGWEALKIRVEVIDSHRDHMIELSKEVSRYETIQFGQSLQVDADLVLSDLGSNELAAQRIEAMNRSIEDARAMIARSLDLIKGDVRALNSSSQSFQLPSP